MRIRRLITALTALALLLTGCTSLSLNGSDILTPPKSTGTRAEIQAMIEQSSGGAYTLIYPADGSYKSAITTYDLNNDGTDEVVALYTSSDGTAHMLTAKSNGESYSFVSDSELSSANVSQICFADINADGSYEILVSCDAGSPVSSLSAYMIGEEPTRITVAEGFTAFATGDIDGNSSDDVLILTDASVEQGARATLLVYSEGAFSEKSYCEADSDIAYYLSLSYQNISNDIVGVSADGATNDGEYTTQLFYYDTASHSLLNPLYTSNIYNSTFRTQPICCYDINDDGIVEIPICDTLPAVNKDESPSAATLAHWSDYQPSSNSLEVAEDTVIGTGFGFLLKTEQKADITAMYTSESSLTLYIRVDGDFTPALTVFRYPAESYDATLTAQAVIGQSGSYIYTYSLPDGSPYTHDLVLNSFIPFDI